LFVSLNYAIVEGKYQYIFLKNLPIANREYKLMKHIFVVNPAAGTKNPYDEIKSALESYKKLIDYEIYVTSRPLDATKFVHAYCMENSHPVRFYACGGDGTLNEVVNGAVGHSHAEVACYPCGSGDDFVKHYGGKERFINLPLNIEGVVEEIDLLKIGERYAANVISFGFDSVVAKTIFNIKRKPVIGGRNSYYTGIALGLFTGMKNKCTVYVDGEKINSGELLLCTIANGSYVGGHFKCAPRAKNNDGLIEVCLARPVSVLTFLRLAGKYREGKHLDDPRFDGMMTYRQGKVVECESPDTKFCISVDGEVINITRFTVEIVPKAIKFVVPGEK
jgi:diacylglycerol kinase (ATP)